MDQKAVKIIIIEDEPSHAEAIRRHLSSDTCKVLIASTLGEFNEIASNLKPDMVIADINLPDGSALSLLKGSIENNPWPVLVMTSHGDEEIAVRAIKSGAIDYIVKSPGTFSEITHVVNRNLREWKSIQKSRENERKFRILFETMVQGVIYHDENGNIIAANPAAEKITGLTLEQMQKRSFFDPRHWAAINEDGTIVKDHPPVVALRTGKPVKDKVIGLLSHSKDRYIWLIVSSIPHFRENESKPYQVFTTFTDITEIKKTEHELKKAKLKAEESDRLKTAFMANMSHEIRTPMNGIMGFADLLKTPELSGESQKMYIDAISSSGERMLDIINDLIDISRIEAGLIDIKKETFDIKPLFSELMMFFKPEAEKKKLSLILNVNLPGNEFLIETDKTRVAQVISNLLKNALKFTKEGRIELGCEIHDGSWLYIYVKDTGLGIRKELLSKIFERFRQGDGAEGHEGVGLGLAIAKAYVELMGGSIGIESETGKGSIFYFTIPLNEGVINDMTQKTMARIRESSEGVRVLIIEDDDLNFTLLRETLKRANIRTLRAVDGQDALEIIQSDPDIDLILVDIKLPGMSGIEVTREIRKFNYNIPVIIQSAYASQDIIQEAFEAGSNDYMTKPIDIKELVKKIHAFSSIS